MYRTLLLILTCIFLSGCFGTALVAGGTAGSAVVSDPRGSSEVVHDTNTTHQVSMKISQDNELANNAHIVVATYNGVLLLVGQAPTQAMKDKAVKIANSVPSVKMIYNRIEVKPPIPVKNRSDDAWITTKVRSKLLTAKGVPSNDVKVVTDDGNTYLLGKLTHAQGKLAAKNASEVAGVKKVIPIFDYTDAPDTVS